MTESGFGGSTVIDARRRFKNPRPEWFLLTKRIAAGIAKVKSARGSLIGMTSYAVQREMLEIDKSLRSYVGQYDVSGMVACAHREAI